MKREAHFTLWHPHAVRWTPKMKFNSQIDRWWLSPGECECDDFASGEFGKHSYYAHTTHSHTHTHIHRNPDPSFNQRRFHLIWLFKHMQTFAFVSLSRQLISASLCVSRPRSEAVVPTLSHTASPHVRVLRVPLLKGLHLLHMCICVCVCMRPFSIASIIQPQPPCLSVPLGN